ncbi:MAG: hydroxymethylglutaryl-CoA reductase, degradative [Gammaproteobacteria bacterium]|jgi:hydroxymethylglutaryl-CoA reductase|nr:hydroxymethylglutaryl-CoA reductase, degradative [Gammaproteobacteria bacterium]
MSKSRISGLHKLSIANRIAELEKLGWLSSGAAKNLRSGCHVVAATAADKMVENVLGVFGLPFAVAPNFIINKRECIVPLVVEEPSIVAGLSAAAAMARTTGGFTASLSESLLIGQIHLVGVTDVEVALTSLREESPQLIDRADDIHPRLHARGGGVRDIEFKALSLVSDTTVIAVHILVDTCDAMGANLVNTICESMAPRLEEISGGKAALKILSNLVDRSVCSATVTYSVDDLASDSMPSTEVRDRIIMASEIAIADPHRAVTHNKGVMNGIDALAIATGNDWRAIEASAHAYAARSGRYSSLTKWSSAANGDLLGEITVPLKPGIVGGTLSSNPAATLGVAIAGVASAIQLAEMMAAVGLAQNFAALRALATSGIQKGHMRLHARSVATAAGTPDHHLDDVVRRLVESGDIKDWKAAEILRDLENAQAERLASSAFAAGKIILLGEHAAVYGRHALAIPIVDVVRASATLTDKETSLTVREWGLSTVLDRKDGSGVGAAVNTIFDELGVGDSKFTINVSSSLPQGMGLGSSAAIAVAIVRAVAVCVGADIDNERVNAIAYACEKLAHGNPSGLDNTLSCYGEPMLFQKGAPLIFQTLELHEPPPLLIGFSKNPGRTIDQVSNVRSRYDKNLSQYEAIFDQMDEISCRGAAALTAGQYEELGQLMNICHGLLNAIEVSTPDLENMITIARENGASGAKLTGAGGGGSIVALCPGAVDEVRAALHQAGYETLQSYISRGSMN